jgi:hypothetical protein
MFETSIAIADAIRSFDLTFITGGLISATGSMYIDDISVALRSSVQILAGDYNNNGIVDAADYVVWRKGLGTIYTQSDYNVWRANFGQTAGSSSGATASAAVPEPTTLVLLMFTTTGCCLRRRRTAQVSITHYAR